MSTKITDDERKELDALLSQRAEIDEKINAILDKYPRCFECGAFEGELHDFMCDCEYCPQCGNQLCVCKHITENDPMRIPFGY
jgi:hypothetical protein